jgi:hypothetical protein
MAQDKKEGCVPRPARSMARPNETGPIPDRGDPTLTAPPRPGNPQTPCSLAPSPASPIPRPHQALTPPAPRDDTGPPHLSGQGGPQAAGAPAGAKPAPARAPAGAKPPPARAPRSGREGHLEGIGQVEARATRRRIAVPELEVPGRRRRDQHSSAGRRGPLLQRRRTRPDDRGRHALARRGADGEGLTAEPLEASSTRTPKRAEGSRSGGPPRVQLPRRRSDRRRARLNRRSDRCR